MNSFDQGTRPATRDDQSWEEYPLQTPRVDQELPEQNMISAAVLRGILWRQRNVLFSITAASVLIAFVISLLTTPLYRATATVRIDPDNQSILEGSDLGPEFRSGEISRYLTTLTSVVTSRSMASRVVDTLKAYADPTIVGQDAMSRPEGKTSRQWQAELRERATAALQGGIQAKVPQDQRLITITFASPDPAAAAKIVNAYVDNFVYEDVRRSLEANNYAKTYLEGQILQTRQRLQDAELRANSYARANRILVQQAASTDGAEGSGSGSTITGSNLAAINSSFTKARADRMLAEQRWRAASAASGAQIRDVLDNTTIQTLAAERSKLIAQIAELRQRYDDSYPEIIEANARIAGLSSQINRATADVSSSLRKEYEVALNQERALDRERQALSEDSLDEQDRRVQLGILNREADGLREQLTTLATRYNQIVSASNLKSSSITTLDSAVVPSSPETPDFRKNLLIGLVIGLAAAVALALLREVLDDRIRSMSDVQTKLGLPLLGSTPYMADGGDFEEALQEPYSSIRTSLDFALPRVEHNVVVITSALPSEGKTLSAIYLAKRYARLGRKTLLVEADLRKPSMSSQLGFSRNENGLVEMLLGQVPLKSALVPAGVDNLDVLAVGPIPPNPVEILSSTLFADFIKREAQNYSIVILDSAPIMGLADAAVVSRLADGVVIMIESNRANFGQTKAALRRMRDADANILGVILTKVHSLSVGESYSYHYNYYRYGKDADT